MTASPIPASLRLAAERYELGTLPLSPAALITADTPTLVGLVRSQGGLRDVPTVFSLLTGGTMTNAGFASAFEDRLEVLSGLTRMLPVMPRLVGLSDMELSLVCLSLPEMVVALVEAGAPDDVLETVVEVSDPEVLRAKVLEHGVDVTLSQLLKKSPLTAADAVHVVGALLWDLAEPDVAALAPTALAFIAPVWRSVFFRAAVASPDDEDIERALTAMEASITMTAV